MPIIKKDETRKTTDTSIKNINKNVAQKATVFGYVFDWCCGTSTPFVAANKQIDELENSIKIAKPSHYFNASNFSTNGELWLEHTHHIPTPKQLFFFGHFFSVVGVDA